MFYKTILISVFILGGVLATTAANANVSPNGDELKQPRYKYKTAGNSFTFFPFLSIERINADTSAVKPQKEEIPREEKIISSRAAF